MKNAYKILTGKPEGNKPPRRSWISGRIMIIIWGNFGDYFIKRY
jgi:hypothetical protein